MSLPHPFDGETHRRQPALANGDAGIRGAAGDWRYSHLMLTRLGVVAVCAAASAVAVGTAHSVAVSRPTVAEIGSTESTRWYVRPELADCARDISFNVEIDPDNAAPPCPA